MSTHRSIKNMMKIESGLAEGQVLQRLGARGANVRILGGASQAGPVLATISSRKGILKGWKAKGVGSCARGQFTALLKGIPAGGPYRLKLEVGKEQVVLRQFFVGDVWLMAGQSNMEGVGVMTGAAKPHALIRAFSMRREWRQAADPLHVLNESPDFCHNGGRQYSPEQGERVRRQARKGVGVGIFFAREMFKRSGVPQGLIATAHGATSMSQWSPDLKEQGGKSLYGSMLLSLRATGQPLAGVLWYQGESDANATDAAVYTSRMKQLVAEVRQDMRQPTLPWVVVQISRVYSNNDALSWNSVQEQQRLLPSEIDHLETVAAIDLSLDDNVHIGSAGFPRLGVRMASAAWSLISGRKKRPPQLRSIAPSRNLGLVTGGPCFDVSFDSVEGQLRSDGMPHGFTLVDAEGKVVPIIYKTTLHGNVVRLHCGNSPTANLFLHYGHGLTPYCNITDERDISLPVFGPVPLHQPADYLPFVTRWKVTDVVPAAKPLNKIACPDLDAIGATVKDYAADAGASGFVNEHENWQGKSGHAFFACALELREPMRLRFLMGYDGPFRLWVNGKTLFEDLSGANPCYADQGDKKISLAAGTHRITVAMDIDEGRAWGFMLRFIRDDVRAGNIGAHAYATPSCSA
jgi:hypothetical protein